MDLISKQKFIVAINCILFFFPYLKLLFAHESVMLAFVSRMSSKRTAFCLKSQ
uniref:Uncharacterized protein n=1 Tax=Octopus bimaculoides TaxID=37653 RepID=A0A0L8HMR5_OCTBM